MSNSTITIVGTVASAPRVVTAQSGVSICSFRLASGERRYDRVQQKWVDGDTSWFGVTAFRALADHALESFRKGERVIVHGRLRVREWENGERSGTSAEIDADALGHDLRWGVSRFEKRSGAVEQTGPSQQSSTDRTDRADGDDAAGQRASDRNDAWQENATLRDGSEPRAADGFLPAAAA